MKCPVCSYDNIATAYICVQCGSRLEGYIELLHTGTTLSQGNFSIKKVLGQGGFGITYLAQDNQLKRPVAIKELFINGCLRQGSSVIPSSSITHDYKNYKARFIKEAQTLAQFQHPNIVNVYSYFEENNTVYMVMEFIKGTTLNKLVEQKGALPEKKALAYIQLVSKALSIVHQEGMLHRDISPDNIMITNDGRVVLIDFGNTRAFIVGKTQSMTTIIKHGYSPLEQYVKNQARFGHYIDIYALGATLYYLLTGEEPVSSPARYQKVDLPSVQKLNSKVSKKTSQAVMKAMEMEYRRRPQSIDDFLKLLPTDDRKKIQAKIKTIIAQECDWLSKKDIKASDELELDLDLERSDFRNIKNAINTEYNISLKRKDLEDYCDDVDDLIDLVCQELIKPKIKAIIAQECDWLSKKDIKASDRLELDLELEKSDFRNIKNEINAEYNTSLKRKDLEDCVDVDDLIELVYEELTNV